MYGMSNNISRPNIAEPGEALSSVWYVEQMAHAQDTFKLVDFANRSVASLKLSLCQKAAHVHFIICVLALSQNT